ncbi:hypothetical protein PFISCL1PPCAC_19067, partial [Pristionchus fissidentatus]
RKLLFFVVFSTATAKLELDTTSLKDVYAMIGRSLNETEVSIIFDEEAKSIQMDSQKHLDYCAKEAKEFLPSDAGEAIGLSNAISPLLRSIEKVPTMTFNSTDQVIERLKSDHPYIYGLILKRVNATNELLTKTGKETQQFVKNMANLVLQGFVDFTRDMNDEFIGDKIIQRAKNIPLDERREFVEDWLKRDKNGLLSMKTIGTTVKKMKDAYKSLSETSRNELEKILCLKSFGRLAKKATDEYLNLVEAVNQVFEW